MGSGAVPVPADPPPRAGNGNGNDSDSAGDDTASGNATTTRPTVVPDFLERSIEPVDGECPSSHPVKGKLSSGIYHQPGGFNYERTRADRCYLDSAAAESDGLRPSKR